MTDRPNRWVMHLDMDAFFASVEQRDNPEYRGKPLAVGALPGRRGVVATCSYGNRSRSIGHDFSQLRKPALAIATVLAES